MSVQFRDYGRIVATMRWRESAATLPPGSGSCLDIGCGSGRLRPVIEDRGYTWVGMDVEPRMEGVAVGDIRAIPAPDGSYAAVVAWQVLEYVPEPRAAFAEMARVLGAGGVVHGSVSFLEPVHGQTRYGLSPLVLDELLRDAGFSDIVIEPGISGFSLGLWTLLAKLYGRATARAAPPLTSLWLLPLTFFPFVTSWARSRLGVGSGYAARWLTEIMPLEFAGHVIFTARKSA